MTATVQRRGVLISVDGPSGVCKTTLTRALARRLRTLGHRRRTVLDDLART